MSGLLGILGNFGKFFGCLFISQAFLVPGGPLDVLGCLEYVLPNFLLLFLRLRKGFGIGG